MKHLTHITLISLLLVSSSLFGTETARKVCPIFIVDGDTMITTPSSEIIRLWGIDCPELDQPWGTTARSVMIELAHKKQSHVEQKGKSYGRTVARLTVANKDIALLMLKMGLAHYTPEYAPNETAYKEAEAFAKENKLGVWSSTKTITPAEWRTQRKEETE